MPVYEDEIEGKRFGAGTLARLDNLAICEECFDGRKTCMEARIQYCR